MAQVLTIARLICAQADAALLEQGQRLARFGTAWVVPDGGRHIVGPKIESMACLVDTFEGRKGMRSIWHRLTQSTYRLSTAH